MEAIRNWLNSARNYDQGVQLYLQHGRDEKLKRLFTIEGVSDFKRKKLAEVLQQLVQPVVRRDAAAQAGVDHKREAAMAAAPAIREALAIYRNNPSKWPAEMDEVLSALHAKWKPMYSERNYLCDTIRGAAIEDEAKAGRMAHRILDLDDQIEAIYDWRDHYLQHGELPKEYKPSNRKVITDPVKMAVALKNAERYVRDYKVKLKKHPNHLKWAAKLKEKEADVQYYKQQLKLDVKEG